MQITTNTTLADIAVTIPGSTALLRRRGLDFCCHGRRSLAEACAERGIDPGEVLADVERVRPADDAGMDWTSAPLDQLVQHIVVRYHETLRSLLPEVLELARTVEVVHADHDACPRGLTATLARAKEAVDDHLAKEEQILFPMILAGHGPRAGAPIQVMEKEHVDHGETLATLRRLTNGYQAPADVCTTWHSLCAGLLRLESELMEHIHLENNILFPRALCE